MEKVRIERLIVVVVALLLLAGCKRDVCDTPIGEVGDIMLTDYPDIFNNVGGTIVLNRGHRGVLVRCEAFGQYAAFECSCPNDHDVRMLPDDDHSAMMLTCPSCGSRFELINGNPLEGSSASCPLHRYSTSVEGYRLYIY